MKRCASMAGVVLGLLAFTASSGAATKDYAQTALNIIPSGQYGSVPPPAGADAQAQMYDGLTPLFDQVTPADLTTYFKSEQFGVATDGPGTIEAVPRAGVTIERDRFNVPHVTGATHDDGVWAAGWIAAEDRALLLQQARYNARVAAIDAPGLDALGLISGLDSFQPSQQTEAEVAKQTQVLEAAGAEGQAVLHDIDVFTAGINDYLAMNSPSTEPWTRNDVYALNALKGQFVGQGGGDEARRSQFLDGLIQRLGKKKGMKVFNDLRQFKNPELPTSVDGRFPYGHIPKNAKGNVILDHESFAPTPSAPNAKLVPPEPAHASNTLMITADRSKTGRPLMVGGPQIGYFYPGLTYEIDMHAGDLQWRGATSAPFPGYVLIGRGQDFAHTLTSAGSDMIDQYVEKLCNGSDTMYVYKGECLEMGTFDAGTLNGDPVSFKTTVHGPVIGYATVDGVKVAISRKRSDYGEESLDLLYNRRLSNGQVHSARSFMKAASLTPQTFNSFYIDKKHVAVYGAGRLPIRDERVDPGLPTLGTGKYEWEGFLPRKGHIQGVDPVDGTITNWNQTSALGFAAPDDDWTHNTPVQRVDLLNRNLDRLASKKGKWNLASVTAAMNAAATQDVRVIDTVPLLRRLLKGTQAPTEQAQQMLDLLLQWRANGGSRLDRDLDGTIDDPGAAVMDGSWDNIANAFMAPSSARSSTSSPPSPNATTSRLAASASAGTSTSTSTCEGFSGWRSRHRSTTGTAETASSRPASRRSGTRSPSREPS
jgi:acyl-homoserine lactone acylase PvdQ